MEPTKYEVYLVNNKRGGVDTFLEQLCSNTKIHLTVNKGHLPNVDLKKFGADSNITAFYEIPDIFMIVLPLFSRKTAERVSYLLDLLTLGVLEFLYAISTSFWVLSKLDASKPLLVVMGGYPGAIHCRIFAWIASTFKKRSVVMSIHNLRGTSPRWSILRDTIIEQYCLKKIKSWIFVSQTTFDSMATFNFGGASTHIIYNGILDVSSEMNSGATTALHHKRLFDFGLVGTFEKRKGFDLAIRAYSKIATRKDIGRLKIYGEGSKKETSALRDLVKKLDLEGKIDFVGFVTDKSEIYQNVDAVIVPSKAFESFGYVALESIQRNVPVIVSDHGGLKEVSEIIGNTNIFKSDNVEALEQMLILVTEKYCENVAQLKDMRTKIRTNFNCEQMVRQYESILLTSNLEHKL